MGTIYKKKEGIGLLKREGTSYKKIRARVTNKGGYELLTNGVPRSLPVCASVPLSPAAGLDLGQAAPLLTDFEPRPNHCPPLAMLASS